MKKSKKRKIVNYIIIGVIFFFMIWVVREIYEDIQIEQRHINNTMQYNTESLSTIKPSDNIVSPENIKNEIESQIEKEYPKEEVITNYKGYEVAAKLEIPKIKLETYILDECSMDSLNKSVAKFWGANPNEIGNLCVAGHNAKRNNNMFYNLKELEIGDKLTISDNIMGKVEYEIYDIYNVQPKDVSCLSQETNGKKEVTLITCTNDGTKRTIVKAREVND